MLSSSVHRATPSLPSRKPSKHTAFSSAPRTLTAAQQQQCRRGSACVTHALPISQLISTAALLAGAWYLSQQEAVAEQDRFEASEPRRPCPSCGGSGVEECFCTKWSDGDVGCSSCNESGWTKCKSCGGGGMAVPIKVSIRKNPML